jgi:hypothetical protein
MVILLFVYAVNFNIFNELPSTFIIAPKNKPKILNLVEILESN